MCDNKSGNVSITITVFSTPVGWAGLSYIGRITVWTVLAKRQSWFSRSLPKRRMKKQAW